MSQLPQTPAAKRTIEEAISPSPSPSLRQPAKKNAGNLPKGGNNGKQLKQAPVMFDPIEFKPHDTPIAPKRFTSQVSPGVRLTDVRGPRTDFSLATVVEDDIEDSVPEVRSPTEVRSPVGLGDTEVESDVELSVETDMATRVKQVTSALKKAGFNSIMAFLDAVYTTDFPARTACAKIQKEAWENGIPRTLALLSQHVAESDRKKPYDLTPYRNASSGNRI